MPRRRRIQMVGRFVERDQRERDKELRELRRTLRRLWRQRQQDQAYGDAAGNPLTEPSESPDV